MEQQKNSEIDLCICKHLIYGGYQGVEGLFSGAGTIMKILEKVK